MKGWYCMWCTGVSVFPDDLIPEPPKMWVIVPTIDGITLPEDEWIRIGLE